MRKQHHQKGMTLISLLMLGALLGFFALVFMKLFPLYMEKVNAWAGVKAVAAQTDIGQMDTKKIRTFLLRNYEISDIERIGYGNIKDHVKVVKIKGSKNRLIQLQYEARKVFFGDLDIVLKVDESIEIPPLRRGG